MSILSSIVLGIVQGLTEFLPISSSGHLVIFHDIFKWQTADDLAFDVFLHWGTLAALVLYFHKDIIRYLKAFLKSLFKWQLKTELDQRISWFILVTMIPAVIVGLFLNDFIDSIFRNPLSVAFSFIVIGIVFLFVEKKCKQTSDLQSLTWAKSVYLGLAQAVALIPGVSRSGATISVGIGLNLRRETAARFSFLMSIPIVFAAGIKKTWDIMALNIGGSEITVYLAGLLASMIVGLLAIKYLLAYLKNHSLNVFAYYRIAAGLFLIIYLIFK